jgi:carboxyl-terminal processing protease
MIPIYRYIRFVFALILLSDNALGQSDTNFCEQTKLLIQTLEKYHYQPIPIGRQLSQRAYVLFLQAIDPHGLYFTASDTATLLACKKDFFGEANNQPCNSTFPKICSLYRHRLEEADSLIGKLLKSPPDFTVNDSIYFGENAKLYFAKDKEMLKKGWVKWLKYEALTYLFSPDSTNDEPFSKTSPELLRKEPEIRNKIKVKEKRYIKRILEHPDGFENYVASAFLNAVAASFDPHSSYFSATDKQNFESSLSTNAPSYGFEVEDSPNGNVQISRLSPGGPAWKSNALHKGDILVQVKWPNGQTIDFSCSDQEEVEEILQSSGSDRMELTVKKPNGQIRTVTLIKKMLKAEDNLIKSFILKGPKNIGYISLPGFYTEWENQDPIGCSNDMAKEIIKLKQENVEGIIIDLRNNGGGAMNEAIALAGTFIEGGPVCILRENNKKLTLLRDMNLGTIYDGPLVLMVNGFSASASEIFAAALQDYHRALIVGSPTFGKATGQVILPLDSLSTNSSTNPNDKINNGFVKITVSKFYRLNGVSYQCKGVIPDILLPAYLEGFSNHEINQPYALVSDSVDRKVKFTPYPKLPTQDISAKSLARIALNERFRKISKTLDSMQLVMKQLKAVPLNINKFKKKEAWLFEAIQVLGREAEQPSTLIKVTNVKYDEQLINLSPYKKEVNDLLIRTLQNDIYIEETYRITSDLINYK